MEEFAADRLPILYCCYSVTPVRSSVAFGALQQVEVGRTLGAACAAFADSCHTPCFRALAADGAASRNPLAAVCWNSLSWLYNQSLVGVSVSEGMYWVAGGLPRERVSHLLDLLF